MSELDAMEAVLPTENKEELSEMMEFLRELKPCKQKELYAFIQGAKFAKSLEQSTQDYV